MIDSTIDDHPYHLFVIWGDLNCQLNSESPFDNLWDDLSSKHNFVYCSHRFGAPGYTYCHESLGQRKLNDHFIVSRQLFDDGLCSNYRIIEDGHNPSDHLPITMTIRLTVQSNELDHRSPSGSPTVKWSKIPDSVKNEYTARLDSLLTADYRYFGGLSCDKSCHCSNDDCRSDIQDVNRFPPFSTISRRF